MEWLRAMESASNLSFRFTQDGQRRPKDQVSITERVLNTLVNIPDLIEIALTVEVVAMKISFVTNFMCVRTWEQVLDVKDWVLQRTIAKFPEKRLKFPIIRIKKAPGHDAKGNLRGTFKGWEEFYWDEEDPESPQKQIAICIVYACHLYGSTVGRTGTGNGSEAAALQLGTVSTTCHLR